VRGICILCALIFQVVVHVGFAGNTPSAPQKMETLLAGKKALVVSLPGAFTPT